MNEGTRQRLAFNVYRDLGSNRSLQALHAVLKREPGSHGFQRVPGLRTIARWSTVFHWQDRIVSMERDARRLDAEAYVEDLKEMNKRQAEAGKLLQEKAISRFQSLPASELSISEAVRTLTEGTRIERLARGDVTERTSVERNDDSDFSGFSMEELRVLAQLDSRGTTRDPKASAEPLKLDAGEPTPAWLADESNSSDGRPVFG